LGLPPGRMAEGQTSADCGLERLASMGGRDADGREPSWVPLPGPSLENPVAVYDPLRQRVIAFGGDSYPGYFNETRVWALSMKGNASWSELVTSGPSPLPRSGLSAIYDPPRDRIL